jgi:hypothetical protein
MLRINIYDLEPGPYIDEQGFAVVVLDVIDHAWNNDKQLLEFLQSPLVMGRDLVGVDKRYQWPLEVFKLKFRKI